MNKSRDVMPPHIRAMLDAGDQSPEVLELVDVIQSINLVVSLARSAPKDQAMQTNCAKQFVILKSAFDFLLYDIGRYATIKSVNNLKKEDP